MSFSFRELTVILIFSHLNEGGKKDVVVLSDTTVYMAAMATSTCVAYSNM